MLQAGGMRSGSAYEEEGIATRAKRARFVEEADIYLINNSLLFAFDGILLKNLLDESDTLKIIIILAPMWLEKVDSAYHHLNWGQNKHSLPLFLRGLVKKLLPEKEDDDRPLSFSEMIILRRHLDLALV